MEYFKLFFFIDYCFGKINKMPTFIQLIKRTRFRFKKKIKKPALDACPQKKAHCLKIVIRSPKKPHSARRKTTRVLITSNFKKVYCYIPGVGHNLQKHSTILMRGGRRRDVPGLKYTAIRSSNKYYDFIPWHARRTARSKYGVPKFN